MNDLKKKVEAISKKDYCFFLGRIYFTRDDGSQNMFAYQATLSAIKYHNTRTEYVISWRSKGFYIIKFTPINNDLSPNILYFNRKIALQFDFTPLIVNQTITQQKLRLFTSGMI